MLFDPRAHEPPAGGAWDPEVVRAAIREITEDAERSFAAGWSTHSGDVDHEGDEERRFRTVYLGGAGVVRALDSLQRRGLVELGRDYVPYLEQPGEADFPEEDHERSFLMGETGIRLVLQRLAPSAANADRLEVLIAGNVRDERREVMWGSPGTMLAARALHDASGEARWLELWRQSADWLRSEWDEETNVWTQHLYGADVRYLGPAHGFAGCVLALSAEADDELVRRVGEVVRREAVEQDGLANWPPVASTPLEHPRTGTVRVQWCHGAPGIVSSLAGLAGDAELDRLLLAGGELTWLAGPIARNASLCHGTAGNGYAFLALLERTGDERWLERARAFAMHSLLQVAGARAEHGRGRFTLWTGDPGTALFLADCLDGGGALPLP
jgi:Lanthionine synthetase C-like protein